MTAHHDVTNLRLEVQVPAPGLPNLVRNPTGTLGGWWWLTPVTNTTMTAAVPGLTFTTTPSQAAYFTTDFMPVAATKYVSSRLDLKSITASHNLKAKIEWYDASKVLLSSTAQTGALSAVQTHFPGTFQAPASTAYAKLRLDFYNGTGNPSAAATVTFSNAMVTVQDTGTVTSIRTNLVPNPSAETNATGWVVTNGCTVARSTAQAAVGSASIAITSTGGERTMVASTTKGSGGIVVTPGKAYRAEAQIRLSATGRIILPWIHWYTASGTYLSATNGATVTNPSGWVTVTMTGTPPSTAARAAVGMQVTQSGLGDLPSGVILWVDAVVLELDVTSASPRYFDGDTTDTATETYAWAGTAHASASTRTTTASTFDYAPPWDWRNILGPAHEITIQRTEFDIGTLTATILDPLLDPAVEDDIRPGRKVRLLKVEGEWETVYEGTMTKAVTEYVPQTKITIEAVDAMASLANQSEPRGVALLNELPYILEGKGVPWWVFGTGAPGTGQVPSASVRWVLPSASVLDQLAITRDISLGSIYVSRSDMVHAHPTGDIGSWNLDFTDNPASLDATTISYTGAAVSFDTEECINTVTVKWLRYSAAAGTTDEITYGPYVDAASRDEWGPRLAEFTIGGGVEDAAAIQTYAQSILAANATPVVRPLSLTYQVTDTTTLWATALGELNSLVDVEYQGATYTPRVRSIEHRITPDAWTVTLGFATDGAVSAPTVAPSPIGDAVAASGSPRGWYSTTDTASVADSTWVSRVGWGVVDAANLPSVGLTYANGVYTVAEAGDYHISYAVTFAGGANGRRLGRLWLNGTTAAWFAEAGVGTGTLTRTTVSCSGDVYLPAGGTVQVQGFQTSGGSLAWNGSVSDMFSIRRAG